MIMGGYAGLTFGVVGIGNGTMVEQVSKESKLRWADHQILNSKTQLQLTGWEADEVTVTMLFIERWCTSPAEGLSILDAMTLFPIPAPLIIGSRPVGTFASTFVISESKQQWKKCNAAGVVSVAQVTTTFREKSVSTLGTFLAYSAISNALPLS